LTGSRTICLSIENLLYHDYACRVADADSRAARLLKTQRSKHMRRSVTSGLAREPMVGLWPKCNLFCYVVRPTTNPSRYTQLKPDW
jgi:hypothetical protein